MKPFDRKTSYTNRIDPKTGEIEYILTTDNQAQMYEAPTAIILKHAVEGYSLSLLFPFKDVVAATVSDPAEKSIKALSASARKVGATHAHESSMILKIAGNNHRYRAATSSNFNPDQFNAFMDDPFCCAVLPSSLMTVVEQHSRATNTEMRR